MDKHNPVDIKFLQQLSDFWSTVDAETLVLIDVDDTLIAPYAGMFNHKSGHHRFIDDLKQQHCEIENFRLIHATWRAQRKTMIIDAQWPEIINKLINVQHASVYGFTQVNTGQYEIIPSMEQWRLDELAAKNIHFTPTLAGQAKIQLMESSDGYACFDHGILFTGPFTKSQLLTACLEKLTFKPKKIVFFDDLLTHIQAVGTLAESLSIEYHGFHYQGASMIDTDFDQEVIAYQQQKLIDDCVWLEDAEAKKELNYINDY